MLCVRPTLAVVRWRRLEGVACGKHDGFALPLQTFGEFADGGGFAHAIHTNNENDEGFFTGVDDERGDFGRENINQFLLQGFVERVRVDKVASGGLLGEVFDDFVGGIYANVCSKQLVFDFF